MSNPSESVTPTLLRGWGLPDPGGSKKARGRAAVVGGSPLSPGAVMLSGEAALRVGAGLATLFVPEELALGIALAFPEAGVHALPRRHPDRLPEGVAAQLEQAQAVLVGPGFDDPEETEARVRAVAAVVDGPVLLDAFALGVLPQLDRAILPWSLVLTPNGEEAALLLGDDEREIDADAVAEIARRYEAVVSCHGMVAAPDGSSWEIVGGSPALGTSGSGDALSGAIVGFLARGVEPAQAAVWGTWAHTRAGNRLGARGGIGFLARELVQELPAAVGEVLA